MAAVRVIARGGFGRVELITPKKGGATVARKVFDPKPEVLATSTPEKLKQRFRREVLVQSKLSSDFFIPILKYDLDADEPWFTMPVAESRYELKIEEDRAAGRIDAEPLADILAALEELHRLGIAHRDLKPSNILRHEGRWKLSDFGLVLPLSEETTTLTSVNSAWGSQRYAAPEQFSSFHTAGLAADIYAFGCILHDLAAEPHEFRVPYQQATCAGALGPIIEKCTEPNPKKRFKSVADLRDVLLKALAKRRPPPSPKAAELVNGLADAASWESAKLKDLVRSLRKMSANDHANVLEALDEERLAALHPADPDAWEELAREYCAWVSGHGFEFEHCDVLIRRIEKIFELGSVTMKAAAALAAAELAYSHNRWFVMRRVMTMCGPGLDENVAERVAIEIVAERKQYAFSVCASRISHVIKDYHPAVAEVLAEFQKANGVPV